MVRNESNESGDCAYCGVRDQLIDKLKAEVEQLRKAVEAQLAQVQHFRCEEERFKEMVANLALMCKMEYNHWPVGLGWDYVNKCQKEAEKCKK